MSMAGSAYEPQVSAVRGLCGSPCGKTGTPMNEQPVPTNTIIAAVFTAAPGQWEVARRSVAVGVWCAEPDPEQTTDGHLGTCCHHDQRRTLGGAAAQPETG